MGFGGRARRSLVVHSVGRLSVLVHDHVSSVRPFVMRKPADGDRWLAIWIGDSNRAVIGLGRDKNGRIRKAVLPSDRDFGSVVGLRGNVHRVTSGFGQESDGR